MRNSNVSYTEETWKYNNMQNSKKIKILRFHEPNWQFPKFMEAQIGFPEHKKILDKKSKKKLGPELEPSVTR